MLAVEEGVSTKCSPHRCPFQGAGTHCGEQSDAIGEFVFVYGNDVFKVVVYYTSMYGKILVSADKEWVVCTLEITASPHRGHIHRGCNLRYASSEP